jgi:hypothetical protein
MRQMIDSLAEQRRQRRFVIWTGVLALSVLLLICLAIAGSYILTINYVNAQHTLHVDQRVPACEHARQIIDEQSDSNHTRDAGLALYNATGCPQILQGQ